MKNGHELTRGTQIIYVPNHADGDITHPDCERGFVTSIQEFNVFCRYWRSDLFGLRTTTCSELTPITNLVIEDSVPYLRIVNALAHIENQ